MKEDRRKRYLRAISSKKEEKNQTRKRKMVKKREKKIIKKKLLALVEPFALSSFLWSLQEMANGRLLSIRLRQGKPTMRPA